MRRFNSNRGPRSRVPAPIVRGWSRRRVLGALATAGVLAACGESKPAPPPPAETASAGAALSVFPLTDGGGLYHGRIDNPLTLFTFEWTRTALFTAPGRLFDGLAYDPYPGALFYTHPMLGGLPNPPAAGLGGRSGRRRRRADARDRAGGDDRCERPEA